MTLPLPLMVGNVQLENGIKGNHQMHFTRLLLVLLVFASSQALAKKCVSGDCENGIGTQLFTNGFLFHGEFKNGTWNGYSVQETSGGTNCEGLTKNGRGEGVQFCTYSSGKRFFGNYQRGTFGGFGMFVEPNGRVDGMGEYARGKLRFETQDGVENLIEELKQMRATAPDELVQKLPPKMRDFSFDELLKISGVSQDEPAVTEDEDELGVGSLDWAKKECNELGLAKGDDGFSDCVLDLMEVYQKY
jgi:hypothetical protein